MVYKLKNISTVKKINSFYFQNFLTEIASNHLEP